MNYLKTAQDEQHQAKQLETTGAFHPDFSHHLYLCSDEQDALGFCETLNHMSLRASSGLSLNRRMLTESTNGHGHINCDDAYYSLVTVKMIIEDIRAVNCAYREANENNERCRSKVDNPDSNINLSSSPIAHDVFGAIDKIIFRAHGVLTLLCDLFARDDVISTNVERIAGAIDSVMLEITSIRTVISDSRKATNKQPA